MVGDKKIVCFERVDRVLLRLVLVETRLREGWADGEGGSVGLVATLFFGGFTGKALGLVGWQRGASEEGGRSEKANLEVAIER